MLSTMRSAPLLCPASSQPPVALQLPAARQYLAGFLGALALDMGTSQACASCPGHSCSSWSQLPEQRLATESITGPTALSTPACSAASGPVGPASSKQGEGPQICLYFHSLLDPCPERSSSSRGIQSPRRQRRKVLRRRETGGIPR